MDINDALVYRPDTGEFYWKVQRSNILPGDRAGTDEHGYRTILFEGVRYRAHRLAWFMMTGAWPAFEIDHINRDPSDNRWANLRDVPKAVNQQNRDKANTNNGTGYLGVREMKGRFVARLQVNKRYVHIGCFDTPEEAHQAYIEKKRVLHAGCEI